jgi:tetratricopeptide (TPR) repeat protein
VQSKWPSWGGAKVNVTATIKNLAILYSDQGKFDEALKLYRSVYIIVENALGADSKYIAASLNNIASVYRQQGKFEAAVPPYERSLAILVRLLGRDNPESLGVQVNLGTLYQAQGRYAEAEEMLTRVATVRESVFGASHPETLVALSHLASLFAAQSRFAEALPLVQQTIGTGEIDAELCISVLREAERRKLLSAETAFAQSYEIVQSSTGSSAALAVQKLAARYAGGSGELARDVRLDQDLLTEAQALSNTLDEQFGRPPTERNAREENRPRKRLEEIALERKDLLTLIRERHPQYSALMQPQPLTLAETQALLGEDEAVLVLAIGAEKSFAWAVTRDSHAWSDMPLPGKAVDERVQRLRHSLTFQRDAPFDTALAYELYRDLLGPILGEIVGKRRLSVVTTGALTSLPLQLLVTADPSGKSLKDVAWLVKSHAVTLVPSVFSLKTMRAIVSRSAALRPMIAFADPVFSASASLAGSLELTSLPAAAWRASMRARNLIWKASVRRCRSSPARGAKSWLSPVRWRPIPLT